MSSLSPRGSLSGASADAVAEDFADSLKDLTQNNRYEISTLTIIAKENTEHAQAISKALEGHIKKASPIYKLPALYVLDSIVKNVGTPYTVYLGRNLYSTFMDAYTLVDANNRRAMEALLKTWKEPIPGSIDKRPVFQLEVVRPIENALIKAKTVALQHQRLPQGGYKNTPTPPQANGQFAPPQQYQQQQQYYRQQPTPQQAHLQSPFQPTPVQQPSGPYGHPPQGVDAETIKRDVAGAIAQVQQNFASNPGDRSQQTKLQALLDLQGVLSTTQLPPEQLHAVAKQIAQLAVPATPQPPQPRPTPPVVSTPQWQPPPASAQPMPIPFPPPLPFAQPPSAPPPFSQPPPQQQMPTFDPQQLTSLQALFQNSQKPSTPQIRAAAPVLQHAPHAQVHQVQAQAAAPAPAQDLATMLRNMGALPPANAAPVAPTPPAAAPLNAQPQSIAALLSSLNKGGPSQAATPSMPMPMTMPPLPMRAPGKPRIPPTQASLKTFRPELLRPLYADQNNQCTLCGRRFLETDEGREKKARHMDWHFRINQRVAERNAAHHRQWFVDEMEWMKLEEFDASTASADDKKAQATKERTKGPEELWVRAPAGVTRLQCSICAEEMRSSHPEELQDWVFMNAAYNNGKIVHATCLMEMTGKMPEQLQQQSAPAGGGGGSSALAAVLAGLGRQGSRTPESMLGKRKATDEVHGSAGKMRR